MQNYTKLTLTLAVAMTATTLAIGLPAQGRGPAQPPIIKAGTTVRVSDHVWVIPDENVGMVPNVGIIVGSRATLVVDTGMGPRNAETVLAEVAKVSRNAPAYLVTTHFHPEHTAGATAFTGATYVVSRSQQQDLDELEPQFIQNFSNMSAANADLLRDVVIRKGDTLFDREYTIDLGDVNVRLLAVGPTHTRGDTVAFVEPDRVLFSGDVVMGKNFLSFSNQSSPSAWLKAFDALDAFKPLKVVPSHREMGDASFIAADRAQLTSVQARVRELKAQGQTPAQIVTTLRPEFQQKYADWANPNRLDSIIRAFAAE
jgi:glyoxylase-like metal-dependent hydrolase (beta-lactamase superfamily II)